jgi:O-succinylbenzoic acid--CoA ligase
VSLSLNTPDWNALSCPPGSVVALRLAPTVPSVNLLLATINSGRIAFPVSPRFPDSYLHEILNDLGCTTLLETPPSEASEPRKAPRLSGALAATLPHTPSILVLTSGSSGPPKAAALSMENLHAAARAANANMPLGPGDGWLLSLPLFHVAGLGVVFRCLDSGATLIYPEPGLPLLERLRQPGVTHVSLVATQLYRLLQEPGGADTLRNLKGILCGGSACPPALLDHAAQEALPLCMSYGMTETAAQCCATRTGEGREAWQTSGRPLTPDTLRISDDTMIEVRGDALFLGYWKHGALDRPLTPDGWFRTGDLGRSDAAGRLIITGRASNRFNVGGENVQPEEIERALLAIPGVQRARVVPQPHPEYVHIPVAFVDPLTDADELGAALREHLPPHAIPRRFLPWPHHLEREGEKLSQATLEAEARME